MRKRYTASAEKVLENAGKEAVSRGMSYVGTEHLLLALIKTKVLRLRCCGKMQLMRKA